MIAATIAFLAGMYVAATIEQAHCAWCPSFKCYSSASCGPQCMCIKHGDDLGGYCYSIDRVQP